VTPARITVMHPGGLGDLVLLSGLLDAFRRQWPEAAVTLLCRPEVASVVQLYPFTLERVVPLRVNPYEWTTLSRKLVEGVFQLLEDLGDARCDLFVAADDPPTWLAAVVAASLAAPRTVAAAPPAASRALIEAVLERLEIKAFAPALSTTEPQLTELERYGKILTGLGVPGPPWPTLALGDDAAAEGQEILAACGAGDDQPLACFYRGDSVAALKRIAPEVYVDALATAAERTNPFALFIGDAGDEEALGRLETDARSLGMRVGRYINRSGSIAPVAAVLSRCSAFFGIDSGLPHLAAALGLPGVTIFGGGHWPRYRAWAPGTIAVVHPLPCFGCGWDCVFGHGVCVESIDRKTIAGALERVLAHPPNVPEVVESANHPHGQLELIGSMASRYREAQKDRALRLNAIVALKATHERDEERRWKATAQLAAERERTRQAEEDVERLRKELTLEFEALLRAKEAQLQLIARAAQERENLARELGEQLHLKETELQRQAAAAAERARVIDDFSERLRVMESDPGVSTESSLAAIEALRAEKEVLFDAAEERLRALEEAHRALGAVRAEGELRAALLSDLTAIVEEREAEIASLRNAQNRETTKAGRQADVGRTI